MNELEIRTDIEKEGIAPEMSHARFLHECDGLRASVEVKRPTVSVQFLANVVLFEKSYVRNARKRFC
jgi:hypothetical protein